MSKIDQNILKQAFISKYREFFSTFDFIAVVLVNFPNGIKRP